VNAVPTPAAAAGNRQAAVRAVGARGGRNPPLRGGAATVEALRGVSLEVAAGELAAIMGPSGSGKSTLLHILAGLDRPTSGEVMVGGRNLSRLGDREQIGFVFQSFNLLPMLTAEATSCCRPGWPAAVRTGPGSMS